MVQQPDTIDLPALLHDAWDAEQQKEKQFHIHIEGREGASDRGGCTILHAKKEAGVPIPKPVGVKADRGAMFTGKWTHYKVQRDTVKISQRKYPGACIGPIIEHDGTVREVAIKTMLTENVEILSSLDLCVATQPGFVLVNEKYENVNADVYELADGAKFLAAWDIKSCSDFAFSRYQTEGLDVNYEAQGLIYMKATGLNELPFLFVRKSDYHMFIITMEWSDDAWTALQAKRYRETEKATELRETGHVTFDATDALFNDKKTAFHCTYCPFSKTHEEEGVKDRVVLDEPCAEVVAMKIGEYTAMFTVGSHWMNGLSMIEIEAVEDGRVKSHNKGGKQFDDTIFRTGMTYKPGWEKKEKDPAAEPAAPKKEGVTRYRQWYNAEKGWCFEPVVEAAEPSTPIVNATGPSVKAWNRLRLALEPAADDQQLLNADIQLDKERRDNETPPASTGDLALRLRWCTPGART